MNNEQKEELERLSHFKQVLENAKRSIDDYDTMRNRVIELLNETNGNVMLFRINDDIRALLSLQRNGFTNKKFTERVNSFGEWIKYRLQKSHRTENQAMRDLKVIRESLPSIKTEIEDYYTELEQSNLDKRFSEENKSELKQEIQKLLIANDVDIINIRIFEKVSDGAEVEGVYQGTYDNLSIGELSDLFYYLNEEAKSENISKSDLQFWLNNNPDNREIWHRANYKATLEKIKRLSILEEYTDSEKDAFVSQIDFLIDTHVSENVAEEISEWFDFEE